MKIADKNINPYALLIEESETLIKQTIKNSYIKGQIRRTIFNKTQKIIKDTVNKIKIKSLAIDTEKSLQALARQSYFTLVGQFGYNGLVLAALLTLNDKKLQDVELIKAQEYLSTNLPTDAKGVPLQTYYKEVFNNKVKPVLNKLAKLNALDPGDVSGRNSLRNLAEMEVRYNEHLDEIAEFKTKGVKLVVSSVHADCSDRCFPYQGKVYSLDGSYGKTEDGKLYEPLEKATDVYYTTKAGKVYKNGLLGFNCRHKLYEYKAKMVIPSVSKAQQEKESKINTKQRLYEKQVRKWREQEQTYKNVDEETYQFARQKAIEWNKKYISFSKQNGRAYYPDRTKVI